MILLGTLLQTRSWLSRSGGRRLCISNKPGSIPPLTGLRKQWGIFLSVVLLCQKTSLALALEWPILILYPPENCLNIWRPRVLPTELRRRARVLSQLPFPWLGPHQMAFIIVAGICLCLYFLFLCFMVFQVFRNISGKQSSLPAMSKVRRLHYEVSKPPGSFRNRCSVSPAWCVNKHQHLEIGSLYFKYTLRGSYIMWGLWTK